MYLWTPSLNQPWWVVIVILFAPCDKDKVGKRLRTMLRHWVDKQRNATFKKGQKAKANAKGKRGGVAQASVTLAAASVPERGKTLCLNNAGNFAANEGVHDLLGQCMRTARAPAETGSDRHE